ncbi:MAG: GNAT family N-acetyltransferase [Scardovia wiggsiae]|uniref:GNAT family N-acetyltransferase n=1 Tax=Scardovia wiggsiae TaxID=230143 RepID=UPI001CAE03D9|nr:GNAT family N-acetyltransferase [Scardovia wiggsiae]MBF1674665.1 GNAT family N-acetyltransferase [Scardovia wiggsiae]
MTRSDMTPESTVPHTADGEKLDSPQNQPPDSPQGAQGRDTHKGMQDVQKDVRALPSSISIPEIEGEMLVLRPAVWEDCEKLDELDAFHDSARITGKSKEAERSTVRAWVSRYLSWSRGELRAQESFSDPEARGVIAWSMFAQSDLTGSDDKNESDGNGFVLIGMVFLIDIDGWAKSARIQVLLGRDYRSRGFSRDAMPRVMTYGFAPEPAGLGMHRIWVGVPQRNTRASTVYKSLGFTTEGNSRDALWDNENERYQDLEVQGMLADEFDPIGSLEAFGMRPIMTNPGIREAMSMHEHSIEIEQHRSFVRNVADISFDDEASSAVSNRENWRGNHIDGYDGYGPEEGTDDTDGIPSQIGQQDIADAAEVTAQGGDSTGAGTSAQQGSTGDPGSARKSGDPAVPGISNSPDGTGSEAGKQGASGISGGPDETVGQDSAEATDTSDTLHGSGPSGTSQKVPWWRRLGRNRRRDQ